MNVVLVKINQILMEKFLKLQDVPRTQVNSHTGTHTGVHSLQVTSNVSLSLGDVNRDMRPDRSGQNRILIQVCFCLFSPG